MALNSTIFRDSHAPVDSWWVKRVKNADGTDRPMTREEWDAEHAQQVKERMLLSNPPIPTAKDGPTSIMEIRRNRIPSTL